jgi:hypothetical protein
MTRRDRFTPGGMEIFPRSSARFAADSLPDPGDRLVGLGDKVLADTRRAVQASPAAMSTVTLASAAANITG